MKRQIENKDHDWIVLNYAVQPSRLECRRCGASYTPSLPCAISMFVAVINEFTKTHKRCKERP